MVICCAGCATNDRLERLRDASAEQAVAALPVELPDLPPDCRLRARSGVVEGDRLDVALLKTDQALSRQNGRTKRCSAWYETLRDDLRNPQEGLS